MRVTKRAFVLIVEDLQFSELGEELMEELYLNVALDNPGVKLRFLGGNRLEVKSRDLDLGENELMDLLTYEVHKLMEKKYKRVG